MGVRSSIAEHELFAACHLIFGKDIVVSRNFLEYLQTAGLKKAFRKRAFELHPDRNALRCDRKDSEDFFEVHKAYRVLNKYIVVREQGFCFPMSCARAYKRTPEQALKKPSQTPRSDNKFYRFDFPKSKIHRSDLLYQGPMPFCPLLFGRFLYYSGITTWQTIIKALVWQRNQRPRFGEIGHDLGWLTEENIIHLLENTSTM